jgi:hypothetical protein
MSYRVTELDPPQQYRVETHSGFFKEAEWHFRLEPVEGGTRVICTTDLTHGLATSGWRPFSSSSPCGVPSEPTLNISSACWRLAKQTEGFCPNYG